MKQITIAYQTFTVALLFTLLFAFTSLAAEGWEERDGAWYYTEQGVPYQNQWLKVFHEPQKSPTDTETTEFYWYYFDESSKMVANRWMDINGKKYRFGEDGTMQYGWYDGDYYLGGPDDGALKYEWQLIETSEPADDEFRQNRPDDVSAAGNQMLWYFFKENGKAIKGTDAAIYGRMYTFDGDGASNRFAYETVFD